MTKATRSLQKTNQNESRSALSKALSATSGGPYSSQPRETLEEGEQVSVVREKGEGPTTGGIRPGHNVRLRQPYWLGRYHKSAYSVPRVWGTESA